MTVLMPEISVVPVADPVAGLPPRIDQPRRASLLMRAASLIAVVVPFLGLLAAGAFLWGWGFSWIDLGLLLMMYFLTGLSITVGYHRLFTHRSFETNRVMQFVFGVLGSMAVEGPLLNWVALHRRHHQFSDRPQDPHSPHHQGAGLVGILRGIWHAHIGWLFQRHPSELKRYVKDLRQSRMLRIVNALFPVWLAAGLIIPAILGGLLTQSWAGVWTGFLWGGLVRIFLVHHVTWSINSVCHLWGRQSYRSEDESRDNILFGVLGMGEGWHHTHHAFPSSARHGLRWWQIDVSYWIIRGLKLLGLAWNVKVPSKEVQIAQRR